MTHARHLALLLLAGWAPAGGAAVGTVPASFGVTLVGAATYDIPITVTPGIGGMTPRLTVSYFGPQERGILGVGFGLAGLSAITPCAKTIAQDGAAAPVLLTAADRYCLDGARLRWVSGTYGDSGATYRTELEQFARVTSYDAVNGRPGWFKVETADGRIYEYGHTSDAVFRAGTAPTAPIQIWALNRISDRAGNAITVVYENSVAERRFRPSSVRYTDSTSQGSGRYQISFVYQAADRPDLVQTIEPSYAGGGSHLETRLLQRLELQHDGTTYRQYLFGYQGGSGANSRLRSVQLCAATTSDCVPETTLDWSVASAGHGAAVAASTVAAPLAPLDLNGDGFEDLVWASSGTWRYMLGSATGYGAVVNSGLTATNPDKALPIEWNGDGRMDLLVDWSDGKWRVLAGTATGLASPVAAGPGGIPSNTANSYWWMADTNGDGRDDLLRAATGVPARLYVRLNGATGFGAETQAFSSFDLKFTANPFPALSSYGQSSTRRADFDGDGRGDVLIYACMWDAELGQCLISFWYYMVANGTSFTNYGNLYSATYSVSPWLGDFNADGLTDVAYPSPSSAKWCVAFAQGGGGMVGACGPSTSGYNLSNSGYGCRRCHEHEREQSGRA